VCALLLYGGFDLGDEQSAWSRWCRSSTH
jgi:hypothetical protein